MTEPELDAAFRAGLAAALKGTGLTGRNLDAAWANGDFPEVRVPGPERARYLIGMSLAPGISPLPEYDDPLTSLWASYDDESGSGDLPAEALGLILAGSSARDPALLAAIVVHAVTADVAARRAAGTLSTPDPADRDALIAAACAECLNDDHDGCSGETEDGPCECAAGDHAVLDANPATLEEVITVNGT